MADFIISNWKLTWDPSGASELVLLDYGERMLAEPAMGQPHESELVSFARALNSVGFHYGNVGHYLTFSCAVDHASPEAARDSLLAHMIVTGAMRGATLKIEVEGGASYELLNAVLQDVTPEMGPDLGTRANRVLWSYSLAGGKLQLLP